MPGRAGPCGEPFDLPPLVTEDRSWLGDPSIGDARPQLAFKGALSIHKHGLADRASIRRADLRRPDAIEVQSTGVVWSPCDGGRGCGPMRACLRGPAPRPAMWPACTFLCGLRSRHVRLSRWHDPWSLQPSGVIQASLSPPRLRRDRRQVGGKARRRTTTLTSGGRKGRAWFI